MKTRLSYFHFRLPLWVRNYNVLHTTQVVILLFAIFIYNMENFYMKLQFFQLDSKKMVKRSNIDLHSKYDCNLRDEIYMGLSMTCLYLVSTHFLFNALSDDWFLFLEPIAFCFNRWFIVACTRPYYLIWIMILSFHFKKWFYSIYFNP